MTHKFILEHIMYYKNQERNDSMAKCKSGKCGSTTRIISDTVNNMGECGCYDVCRTPICGFADYLGLFAPVIYDEIGINLCAAFDLGVDILTTYPTASSASAQIIDISYSYGAGNVQIGNLTGRPNCYSVTLSNLTVQFAVSIYDDACRLLDTIFVTGLYLPSDTTAATYNEDTNPSAVTLDIFAPYGVAYNAADATFTAALNNIGFLATDNVVRQGLNLYGVPKVLNFDVEDSTITMGITLVLQSLYFAGYKVKNAGRIDIPKGCIAPVETSQCLKFVEGDLLNLAIKPLNIGVPANEQCLKNDCSENNTCKEDCTELELD